MNNKKYKHNLFLAKMMNPTKKYTISPETDQSCWKNFTSPRPSDLKLIPSNIPKTTSSGAHTSALLDNRWCLMENGCLICWVWPTSQDASHQSPPRFWKCLVGDPYESLFATATGTPKSYGILDKFCCWQLLLTAVFTHSSRDIFLVKWWWGVKLFWILCFQACKA